MKNQSNSIHDEAIDSLIAKILGGEPTEEDILKLENWRNESDTNKEYFEQLKNIWQSSGTVNVSADHALNSVLKTINKVSGLKIFLNTWQKIAAVLILPLFLATLWLYLSNNRHTSSSNVHYQSVTAAFGTYSTLMLPDGTKVWLNSGSTIQYPEKFTNEQRNVLLTGEAYFEVESDSKHPFLVNTPRFTVKATGTRFNVMAYPDDHTPSVALAEGKVSIMTTGKNHNNGSTTHLKPDQLFTFNIDQEQTFVRNDDAYKYYAWKDGKMVFRNDLLTEVVNRISRQYNVEFEIIGKEVRNYRFRATFENESLQEVLYLLKLSSHFNYRIEEQKMSADNTYSRKKIIIYTNNK